MTLFAYRPARTVIPMVANGAQAKDARSEEHGKLIKERRLDLGLNRPAFVAEMAKHGQDITPDYLNKLESGRAPLSRASLPVREALRAVLGFPSEEWQQVTGLYVVVDTMVSNPDRYTSLHLPDPEPLDLPDELLEAVSLYGKRFPDLTEPKWQQFLASFRARGMEGDTPEDWLDLYRNMARHGIQPEKKD